MRITYEQLRWALNQFHENDKTRPLLQDDVTVVTDGEAIAADFRVCSNENDYGLDENHIIIFVVETNELPVKDFPFREHINKLIDLV